MAKKRKKPAPRPRKPAREPQPRKRRPSAAAPPPPVPFDQELLQLAKGAAGTLQRMLLTALVLAAIAGIAATLWALRPTPTFSSEGVAAGSPFDVTFRVENGDPWMALANLRIRCVLAQVRASPISPTMVDPIMVDATNVRLAGKAPATLEPGEAGTFTCPLAAALGQPARDEPGIAERAEIYFRSEYDLPLIGAPRLTHNSARFILNTHLLPPRWTRKPSS
jgi:hypothetical protein